MLGFDGTGLASHGASVFVGYTPDIYFSRGKLLPTLLEIDTTANTATRWTTAPVDKTLLNYDYILPGNKFTILN